MNKFKYLKISNNKQIRYIANNYKKNLYVVFLHGFMSNIEGEKPNAIFKYTKNNKLGFLALEYSPLKTTFLHVNIQAWCQ